MSRLVVVSNRVTPVTGGRGASQAGGLAVGVLETLRESGGIWFGWSGEVADTSASVPKVFTTGKVTYATVDLSESEYDGYYAGFSNRTLWPLFHYRLDLASFNHGWYETYRRVNQLLAEHLVPHLRDDDTIWVHDYHLIPMALELRRLRVASRIGFFLHIPFPAPEVYLALPWHRDLAEALLEYDVVGFQTDVDLQQFHDYLVREGVARVGASGTVRWRDRQITTDSYQIGIDTDAFGNMAHTKEVVRQSDKLRRSLIDRDLIIGVDRLDYTKGIPDRLRAYERLLQLYPEHRAKVTFMQISAPSRELVPEYLELRHEVEALSGRINGQYSEAEWVPLRYINRGFARRTLAGYLRISRIGLVTPLRDGMNLVALEFVAAQDFDDPGVLVLSRFAGAATGMDGAIIVNPYDVDEVAEAMHRSLVMPLVERQERWQAMLVCVKMNDIALWRERFIGDLRATVLSPGT